MKNKKILFYPASQKKHTLYQDLIETLSSKYDLVSTLQKENSGVINKIRRITFFRFFYHKFIRKFLNPQKFSNEENFNDEGIDLIYASNKIPPGNKPYILDLEFVNALSGYNFHGLNFDKIKEELEAKRCKAIVCWNRWSYETLIRSIDCSAFTDKIQIIPFAIKSEKITKTPHSGCNLLFVSSVNNPDDFELKGGLIALETYSKLVKKSNKNLNFYIRAKVKKSIIRKYHHLKGVNFLTDRLTEKEMRDLFLKSDILLEPLPGINLALESLNYQLPVVCFDGLWFEEIYKEGKNSFLVSSKEIFGNLNDINKYLENLHLNFFKLYNKKRCDRLSNEFMKKTLILVENETLRKKFGKYSKGLIVGNGKFSLKKRTTDILKVIDEAMQ